MFDINFSVLFMSDVNCSVLFYYDVNCSVLLMLNESCSVLFSLNERKIVCTACNKDIESNKNLKDRTVSKSCYKKNRRESDKNISSGNESSTSHQHPKLDNKNYNRTLEMDFSNCGKNYLIIYILLQKQEPIFIITKSLNQ